MNDVKESPTEAGRPAVFVSCSRLDRSWFERIRPALEARGLRVLHESQLWEPSSDTVPQARLEQLWNEAQLGLLLLSVNAFGSRNMQSAEWPHLLHRQQAGRLRLIAVLIEPSDWQASDVSESMPVLPRDRRPLSETANPERAIDEVVDEIAALASRPLDPDQSSALVPMTQLETLRLGGLCPQIVERASGLMHGLRRLLPVTTSALLFAILGLGHDPGIGRHTTPQLLADAISEDALRACRQRYLDRKGASSDGAFRPGLMTARAWDAFVEAARIAEATSGRAEIHARHLTAALILESPTRPNAGALARLAELGVEPATLRALMLEAIVANVPDDNPDRWAEAFGGAGARRVFISGYDPDSARGKKDLLGVTPDVNAFASLIAATTVVPPLSIGLFGDWGSGKSFFMHQLRLTVDHLACRARAQTDVRQRDLPYYKRIVQIEFNAWHYAEGNLWASLVEHIFDNLRVEEGGAIDTLQKKILEELHFTRAQADRADAERAAAEQRVEAATRELGDVAARIDEESEQLARLTAEDVLAQVGPEDIPESDRAELGRLLAQSGVQPASDGARDLLAALDGARQTIDRGGLLLGWVSSSGDPRRQAALLATGLLCPIALATLVGLVVSRAGAPDVAGVSALFTGFAGLAGGLAAGVRRASGWLNAWTARAEGIKRRADVRVAARRAEGQREITRLQQLLRQRQAEFAAARQKADEAQAKLDEKRAELERTTPGGLLASFIEDRVMSNDYRQHLGVLAVVRRDFEHLSELMELQNWQLSAPGSRDDVQRRGIGRFETLDEERRAEQQRVNRIVLYIDDLDRCPPRKVVEVLQAVHLLLAFPLFVVVVGVDARWVERSLETRYGNLLTGGDATPADYLEKIFQIPFWLEQTQPAARERMLRSLLGPSVDLRATLPGGNGHGNGAAPPRSGDGAPGAPSPASAPPPGAEAGSDGAAHSPSSDPAHGAPPLEGAAQPAPEGLTISEGELAYIAALSPILGRSPRSLKRFVNVYRLVKASMSEERQRVMVATGQFRALLFLLALATGAPRSVEAVVDELDATPPDRPLADLVAQLNRSSAVQDAVEWPALRDWLTDARIDELGRDAGALLRWLPRVRRYSFGLGRPRYVAGQAHAQSD